MKKKLLIAFILAFVLALTLAAPAIADPWDFEDTEVAANEDFINGVGWDGASPEQHFGEQSWFGQQPSPDGYNLYRGDVTDTGNLDNIWSLVTRTPDVIDLPGATIDYTFKDSEGLFYYMTSESPDTWYWALAPRGYNKPAPKPSKDDPFYNAGQFDVILCSTAYYGSYRWEGGYLDGKILRDDLSQVGKSNGDYYRLDIPAGTEITSFGSRVWGLRMKVDFYGQFITFNPKNIQFSNVCSVSKLVGEEWVEVVSFVEIHDGTALQVGETVPASIYPGSYVIANNVVDKG